MSGMQYEFDDSKTASAFRGGRYRRKNKSKSKYSTAAAAAKSTNATSNNIHSALGLGNTTNTGTSLAYRLDTTTSIDNTEDGSVSLTYSASSSQAGESTDSSIADLGVLLQIEKEHQHHLLQQQQAQRMRNGSFARNFNREKSNCDSLGYSDDDDGDSVNYANWTTISGQPSDSFAHDGGSTYKSGSTPKSYTTKKSSIFSPQSITADLHSCNGSAGTPNTPPPRHSSKKSLKHDTEVWYQKWWMCGFTDALNLNPKCMD